MPIKYINEDVILKCMDDLSYLGSRLSAVTHELGLDTQDDNPNHIELDEIKWQMLRVRIQLYKQLYDV